MIKRDINATIADYASIVECHRNPTEAIAADERMKYVNGKLVDAMARKGRVIKRRGTYRKKNQMVKLKSVIMDKPRLPLIRPAAEYTNIKMGYR